MRHSLRSAVLMCMCFGLIGFFTTGGYPANCGGQLFIPDNVTADLPEEIPESGGGEETVELTEITIPDFEIELPDAGDGSITYRVPCDVIENAEEIKVQVEDIYSHLVVSRVAVTEESDDECNIEVLPEDDRWPDCSPKDGMHAVAEIDFDATVFTLAEQVVKALPPGVRVAEIGDVQRLSIETVFTTPCPVTVIDPPSLIQPFSAMAVGDRLLMSAVSGTNLVRTLRDVTDIGATALATRMNAFDSIPSYSAAKLIKGVDSMAGLLDDAVVAMASGDYGIVYTLAGYGPSDDRNILLQVLDGETGTMLMQNLFNIRTDVIPLDVAFGYDLKGNPIFMWMAYSENLGEYYIHAGIVEVDGTFRNAAMLEMSLPSHVDGIIGRIEYVDGMFVGILSDPTESAHEVSVVEMGVWNSQILTSVIAELPGVDSIPAMADTGNGNIMLLANNADAILGDGVPAMPSLMGLDLATGGVESEADLDIGDATFFPTVGRDLALVGNTLVALAETAGIMPLSSLEFYNMDTGAPTLQKSLFSGISFHDLSYADANNTLCILGTEMGEALDVTTYVSRIDMNGYSATADIWSDVAPPPGIPAD